MNLNSFITIDPEKRFGKPILIGTRISVADVLGWLANGMTKEEIIVYFPQLTEESINACLFLELLHENTV